MSFQNQSQLTEIKVDTLCPTWDQTLIFEGIDIYESVESVAQSPPTVVVELFDKDVLVRKHKCCTTVRLHAFKVRL